jgi:DHA3 family macrolide efflux protein-like MFS transporter
LLLLVLLSALFTVAVAPMGIMAPLQVTRNFGTELWRLSAIEIALAGGMILGGMLVGIWCFRNKIYSIGVALVAIGILTISFGLWSNFIPYLLCMALCGIPFPYINAPSMTLLQEKVAPNYLGRVLSVYTMRESLALPFGMLLFGPLADIININFIMIGTGIMVLFLGTLYFISKTLKAT